MKTLKFIDSHTGGEPTRFLIEGYGQLPADPISALHLLNHEKDWVRTASLFEPRSSDVVVGAILLPPQAGSDAGIVFCNFSGYLGMCGHGTIGVVASLAHLGIVNPGPVTIDTPPGRIQCHLDEEGFVTLENVPSYRTQHAVQISIPGFGDITGDVAYGGNWFFLVKDHPFAIELATISEMTAFTTEIRRALVANKITGEAGEEIDHIELFSDTPTADSRSFVLCPGLAYDRSPCGTGTSAKLACLFADGKLEEGQWWTQESVIGSQFQGKITVRDGKCIPTIRGKAFISAVGELVLDPADPFRHGIL